jgi:hypothetical protein
MRIRCAAILHDDVIYQGRSHPEIGHQMLKDGVCERPYPGGPFQGFVTDKGNFVDRRLALHLAIEAGQVEEGKTCNPKDLYSEDLIHSKVYEYVYGDYKYEPGQEKSLEANMSLFGEGEVTTILADQMTNDSLPQVQTKVIFSNGQIFIHVEGYGDCCSTDGHGHPIAIELADGDLRVIVWGDINCEDPTRIISMKEALEAKRIER